MSDDRTEKATPKKREDARKKGQIARRPDLAAAASFLGALLMFRVLGDYMLSRAGQLFIDSNLFLTSRQSLNIEAVHGMLINASISLALLSLPIVAGALVAGLVGNFAQGGLTLSAEALKPRTERFNPVANLKRVFGTNGPIELLKGFLKLGGLAAVSYGIITRTLAESPLLLGAPIPRIFASMGELVYGLGLRAGGVLFLIAGLDYLYGWYKHEKSLRMTKQEIRDEFRRQEGDPLIKNQRRRAAKARLQRRIATEVPRADVIVTNPTHFAVALKYDRERDAAPMVLAKGADLMAKRIRRIAEEHEIPIVENPPLARSLYNEVEMGHTIPSELFRAVAELLAYVYRQRQKA
jgi:flagellar biosynthetic protein FlhB